MKRVMVFGVFDGLHQGHRAMLKEAKSHGDYLIAVVAQDHIIRHIKGREPNTNLIDRFEHLAKEDGVDKVVIGDAELSVWDVINRHEPDVVALGYDQQTLWVDLENNIGQLKKRPEIIVLSSFEPNVYHASLINTK